MSRIRPRLPALKPSLLGRPPVVVLALGSIAIAALMTSSVILRETTGDVTHGAEKAGASPHGAAGPLADGSPAGPSGAQEDDVTVLWQADMEEGSLADWYFPETSADAPNIGGGEFDSDIAVAAATQERAHTGRWSARLGLPEGAGGTRLFRWRETRALREVLVKVWLYFPRAYRLDGEFWNLLQLKSRSKDGDNDAMWILEASTPKAGRMRLDLVWWHRTLEGPHAGESGFRRLRQRVADIPVARWFELKMWVTEAHDFTGRLRVWQDRRLLFDMDRVRTSYRNCAYNVWCTSNELGLNNYSDGVSPSPVFIYADDAEIAVPGRGTSERRR